MRKSLFFIVIITVVLILLGVGCFKTKKIEKEAKSIPSPIFMEEKDDAGKKENMQQAGKATVPSQGPKEESQLSTPDSQSKDITDIPQVPNSIQIIRDKTDDFDEVIYQVKETGLKILDYYVLTLPQQGWNFTLRTEDMASFKKAEITCDIQILEETDGVTTYKIIYWAVK